MNTPLVSVIIPVYNMEQYLEETVRSVLASTYSNIEIILINDGSTDKSLSIAEKLAMSHAQIKVFSQANSGVCKARNKAISLASGALIFPLDSDDTITPTFISDAVLAILSDPEVKVVAPKGDFFGDKTGYWNLPKFSIHTLARKNILSVSALYWKKDWERVGGYCTEISTREDWEFWISVLKDGGKVIQLPEVGLHYRIRKGSKRIQDRKQKRILISVLNKRHPDFFRRELGGPLQYNRSWSKVINFFRKILIPEKIKIESGYETLDRFVYELPKIFSKEGTLIHKGRNEIKSFEIKGKIYIVKSYKIPKIFNKLIYTFIRKPKAIRAFNYAKEFRSQGIGSPTPVAYYVTGRNFLMHRSYFISLKSECPYTYRDFATRKFERKEEILKAIGAVTGRMHECGYLHKDYSAGNILFNDDKPKISVEIIDLNRMNKQSVDLKTGCKNFERLPASPEMATIMAKEYAKTRNFDETHCVKSIIESTGNKNH